MMRNYLKAALRNILRQRTNTAINIVGLTLGITGALIIFLIIDQGNSFDTYHSHYDRIYRVVSQSRDNGSEQYTEGIPTGLPEAIKTDFPQVQETVFTSYRRNSMLTVVQKDGTIKKYEEPLGIVITEPSFFRVFDRNILIGSSEKGLDDPNEAIISQEWANKYFGRTDATGEIIRYEDNEYKVTAVMEDHPKNTDLPFQLMLSYSTIKKELDNRDWGSVADSDNCYILLTKNASVNTITEKLPALVEKYIGKGDNNPQQKAFILQPLSKLHSDIRFGNYNTRMPDVAKISFIVIGLFLLLTACVNFINLTTAEAIKRTKEVGIRKSLGSTRTQLILKFISETFLITVISVVLSLAFTQIVIATLVNPFLSMSLTLNLFGNLTLWVFLALLTLTVSLCSGLYPAFVVSGFKPANILKGHLDSKSTGSFGLRKSLVIAQFFISQLFIIAAIVMLQQMDFMENKYLGFTKEEIVTVPIPIQGNTREAGKMHTLKNEVLRLPGVAMASLSSMPPASGTVVSGGFTIEGRDEQITQIKQVDADYLDLFEIGLKAGSKLTDIDTMTGFVVNEEFAKVAGYTNVQDIVGHEIDLWGKRLPEQGVVKDFNTTALEKRIGPVLLMADKSSYRNLSIKLNTGNLHATVKAVQNLWEETYPEYIFKYEFLDQQVENMYRGERKTSAVIAVFAGVAVVIGCLGLFGLVTFMANQKAKEVSIRKVLGATVNNVMILFSKDFAKLILISFVLSTPISAFVMNEVLKEFAYHITLGPAIFLSGLFITLLITVLTVGARAYRAAAANPVDSLRSE